MECIKLVKREENLTVEGKKIQIARVEKGWTITKLSNVSGVTRKTIAEIEKGRKRRIRYSTIEQISNSLGKQVEQFCVPKEEGKHGKKDELIEP